MAHIDIEVYIDNIKQQYTIIRQMIEVVKTLKDLGVQGNLNDTDIKAINTSIEQINAKINNINQTISSQLQLEGNNALPPQVSFANSDSTNKLCNVNYKNEYLNIDRPTKVKDEVNIYTDEDTEWSLHGTDNDGLYLYKGSNEISHIVPHEVEQNDNTVIYYDNTTHFGPLYCRTVSGPNDIIISANPSDYGFNMHLNTNSFSINTPIGSTGNYFTIDYSTCTINADIKLKGTLYGNDSLPYKSYLTFSNLVLNNETNLTKEQAYRAINSGMVKTSGSAVGGYDKMLYYDTYTYSGGALEYYFYSQYITSTSTRYKITIRETTGSSPTYTISLTTI